MNHSNQRRGGAGRAMWRALCVCCGLLCPWAAVAADQPETAAGLKIGVAVRDITPPEGFPMAGYYHERLAEGTLDPLLAKAVVFRDQDCAAALVICDLIGIATDLSRAVRQAAAQSTGIPEQHIVVAATHSHTAPDYMRELYLNLGGERRDPLRSAYIEKLIQQVTAAIVTAHEQAAPAALASGSAEQTPTVSFHRRFVMRDGSVRTWASLSDPQVVRAAGPIDPEISLLAIHDAQGKPRALLSNFALHLDTVGGTKWSADYPYYIEKTLRSQTGAELISLFGTGCCGDINHADPTGQPRRKADAIGEAIGLSIHRQLANLTPLDAPRLTVKAAEVHLPLQDATSDEVERSVALLARARKKEAVDFYDHVTAYKKLILDHLRHPQPFVATHEHITWGLSRSLAGVGETLPVSVTVMALNRDVAVVCLPGEVFVDLGLAIKRASPFRTTLVIELANHVETIYVPHRAAYAGGGYEVTNSNLLPGGGEILVETAVKLLREAAAPAP